MGYPETECNELIFTTGHVVRTDNNSPQASLDNTVIIGAGLISNLSTLVNDK